jgi:predicted unusual protein kinase regulating ubiquinone biosynthesis (AarF/ABC1/UbiB family)
MRFSGHHLKRYKDLGLLYYRYGRPVMTSPIMNGDADAEEHKGADPEQLPKDLEKMGPTFVKLGQLLSSRPDLMPPRYIKALTRLQDDVAPFPTEEAEHIVETELGAKMSKLFQGFDPVPLAAASLGQVHKAILRDGREVVVKIQRPNIRKVIAQDFDALRQIAEFMSRHTEYGQRYDLEATLDEMEQTVAHELDYCKEAMNMRCLRKHLAEFPRIIIPAPIDDYVTHKVLTMEFIDGSKITSLNPVVRTDLDGMALADELFRAYLKQVLVDGLFHADPHPGNVFLTLDNNIALLDVGMVGHTSAHTQEALLKILLAVSEGNSDEAADTAIRISEQRSDFDEMVFRHKIAQLVADQHDASLGQMDIGKMMLSVSSAAADAGLRVPTELTLLGKTLLQLDEVGRLLAPNFDPNAAVRKHANELMNRRMKDTMTEGRAYATLLEAKEFMSALPSRLNKIMDAVGNAEFNVNVKPAETQFVMEGFQKVANRISTGLVLAALIIGAALLMQVDTKFTIFGYPGLAMVLFLAAATGGFWFLLNVVWSDNKRRRD